MKYVIGIPLAAWLWVSVLVWAVGDPAWVGWDRIGPSRYQMCLNGDRLYSVNAPLAFLAQQIVVIPGGCK